MMLSETEEKRPANVQNSGNLFLYFAAAVVYITPFTQGVIFAWITPVTTKLESTSDNPLGYRLNVEEISWLASLAPLGAVVGPFVGGYLADKIGRKHTFTSTIILSILSFCLLAFGGDLNVYYVARFLGGITVGTLLTILPMYIGEIAEVRNRGALGAMINSSIVIGFLYSFAVGPFVSIQIFSLSCMIWPILFLIIFVPFIPETPCFLIMKGKEAEAKGVLRKFRSGDVEEEFATLRMIVRDSLTNKGEILDIFKTIESRRGITISVGLLVIQQFTAYSPVMLYLQVIFQDAGSTLSKEVSTIIIGVVQVLGNLVSSLIVDKFGRKPLLLISMTLSTLMLATLSLYFYLLAYNIDVSRITWLPLCALIVYIFTFGIGIGPLPVTILSEIFPPHVKSAAATLTVAFCYLFSFGTTKLFAVIVDLVNNGFAFLLFVILSAIGVVFIMIQVPETKGKKLTEILETLRNK